jgi:hypothetical protein
MTALTVVPAAAPMPAATSARTALSEHLAALAAIQHRYDALRVVWNRMQAGKDVEARCLSVLQTQTHCEEEAMREWARNPEGVMPVADAYARQMNEEALANARRISTTIAAAEPDHIARQTQAVNDLAVLRNALPGYVHAVMLEDVAALREQLNATIALANEQSANLFGLRSYFEEHRATEAAQSVPVTHEMWPMQSAIRTAHQHWQSYAERLLRYPDAKMEDLA